MMQVNFVESNPIPVKFAMAALGLCEGIVSGFPMVSPRQASQDKILATLKAFGLPVVPASSHA
jgi:Dihydrodipicolinate synthase/N-acetylneuraminate lyase